jgi:hypothetical protein
LTIGDWLSLIGLAFAIGQLFYVGSIARQTKTALDSATGRVSLYNFLLIVPELSRLEREIEDAAFRGEPDELRGLLMDWRDRVGDLQGVLQHQDLDGQKIQDYIRESLQNVTLAKANLLSGKNPDLLTATKRARKSIDQVCIEVRRMASAVRSSATASGLILAPVDKSGSAQPEPKDVGNKTGASGE